MAVNVIDNVDKGVNKKAKGCYQNRLLKGWQWRIDTHVGTGRLLTRGTSGRNLYTGYVEHPDCFRRGRPAVGGTEIIIRGTQKASRADTTVAIVMRDFWSVINMADK